MTFLLQKLLSLLDTTQVQTETKKLNYSMLLETSGQALKITRLIGD